LGAVLESRNRGHHPAEVLSACLVLANRCCDLGLCGSYPSVTPSLNERQDRVDDQRCVFVAIQKTRLSAATVDAVPHLPRTISELLP
jgi:hypothetical protein